MSREIVTCAMDLGKKSLRATRVAARYVACGSYADASDDAMRRFRASFTQRHLPSDGCGKSFCRLDESLYFYDRCWNPRATCAIAVETGGSVVVAQQHATEPAPLHAGEYLSVIGPAAAFGVAAEVSFADSLRYQLKMPVINLGRGGAGPNLYLSEGSEGERVSAVLAQSRAVIILVMAGRSSANSLYGPEVRLLTLQLPRPSLYLTRLPRRP